MLGHEVHLDRILCGNQQMALEGRSSGGIYAGKHHR
jgi:hypothetical protein